MAICVGPPTVAVTVNVTVVEPPVSVAVAVVVCVPGAVPKVRVAVARPSAFVIDSVGPTEPPPVAANQVTATPATGLPLVSVMRTSWGVASVVFTCPLKPSPELFTMVVGAPATAVAVKVTGLPLSPGEVVAVSVCSPTVGPRVHDVAAAMPLAFVNTGVTGVTVPLPDAAANVTETSLTGLLLTSRTSTAGGTATAVPAVAD